MPPRTGPNGAVAKPSSHTARNVIDLTGESSNETSRNSSAEGEEPEDASSEAEHQFLSAGTQGIPSEARQATLQKPITNDHQRAARHSQRFILEDSFILTSVHHRPWGAGDHFSTIGAFSAEREAEVAANTHFEQQCASQADGWESEWRRRPGDGMLQLHGYCEDGEDDSESYTASIKRIQQRRPVPVQPSVPSIAQSKVRVDKPRHVYVVKEEQRINVGEDDPQGFYNDLGDLKAVEIRGIYMELDDANDTAREIYDVIVEDHDGKADTLTNTLKKSMAEILVADPEEMMTYFINVEKRSLQ